MRSVEVETKLEQGLEKEAATTSARAKIREMQLMMRAIVRVGMRATSRSLV
jgi:hypothetical protein